MFIPAKALKSTPAAHHIGGYGIVWGGPGPGASDLEGEYFDRFQSDLWEAHFVEPVLLWEHGLDDRIGRRRLGKVVKRIVDETGVWFEAMLTRAADYRAWVEQVMRLVNEGVVGMSTGSVPHLVERGEDGLLKSWPVAELSLTVAPAEWRTVGARPVAAELRAIRADLRAAMGRRPVPADKPPDPLELARAGQRLFIAVPSDRVPDGPRQAAWAMARRAAGALGLRYPPAVRFVAERGTPDWYAAEVAWGARAELWKVKGPADSCDGFFDRRAPAGVWIKLGLDARSTARTVAHEIAHFDQYARLGEAMAHADRDALEAEADAFAGALMAGFREEDYEEDYSWAS